MKKIISKLAFGAMFAVIVPVTTFAQNAADYSFTKKSKSDAITPSSGDENKTSIKTMETSLASAKANSKASTNFSKNHKDATDVMWNTEGNLIVASFAYAGTRSRAVYNKKGNLIYTILNYHEEGMAPDTRRLVKGEFPDFKITFVQEITQGVVKVILVHLDNGSTLKQILVCDDEITEYKEFQKSM